MFFYPPKSEHDIDSTVGIWQLGQYLQHRVIPLLCLLMVQQHILIVILLLSCYCLVLTIS